MQVATARPPNCHRDSRAASTMEIAWSSSPGVAGGRISSASISSGQAAAHGDRLPGYVAGAVRREEDRRCGQLLGPAESPHEDGAKDRVVELQAVAEELAGHR